MFIPSQIVVFTLAVIAWLAGWIIVGYIRHRRLDRIHAEFWKGWE